MSISYKWIQGHQESSRKKCDDYWGICEVHRGESVVKGVWFWIKKGVQCVTHRDGVYSSFWGPHVKDSSRMCREV